MSTDRVSPRRARALSHDQNIDHDDHVRGNAWARLYRGQTHYDFINRWHYWFALSGTIIAVGLVALGVRGLNFSIDFKGGTVWAVPATASVKTVSADLGKISSSLSQATITQLTNRQTGKTNIEVQAPATLTSNSNLVQQVTKELATIGNVSQDQVTLNAIGPSWGSDITGKAVEAVIVFLVLISACIAVYFEAKMAVAALVALLHDMLVTVGIYALSGFQVSPDTVIAFLTVLGYSLYDTIVVFDKVKENTRGLASTNRVTYTDVVNLSMNQVLARSINTSFVAIMPVFCILVIGSWILGASALNDFGLALFIGLMSGAYSSIFIASPILSLLKEREPRYVEIRRRLAAYPSSRQVLTPATVAGGVLLGSARTAGMTTGTGSGPSGSGPSGAVQTDVAPGGGWGRQCRGRQCRGRQCRGRQCRGRQCRGRQCRGRQCRGRQWRHRARCHGQRRPAGHRRAGRWRELRELRRAAAAPCRWCPCRRGSYGPSRPRGPRPRPPAPHRPSAGRRW
jgi:preprotein translocase subunit SecF